MTGTSSASLTEILAWREEYHRAVFGFRSALVAHQAVRAQLEVATAAVHSSDACQHFAFSRYSQVVGLELATELDPSATGVPSRDQGKGKTRATLSDGGDGGDSDDDVVSRALGDGDVGERRMDVSS